MAEKIYNGLGVVFSIIGTILTVFPQNDMRTRIIIALFFFSLFFTTTLLKLIYKLNKVKEELKKVKSNRDKIIVELEDQSEKIKQYQSYWQQMGTAIVLAVASKRDIKLAELHKMYIMLSEYILK